MQRLRLAEPADAVICALDSLNYLMRPDDCRKTFRRVYDALKPGGLFVFDINTPAKLRGLDGQVFLDETDDTYCVWRTEFDAKSGYAIMAWIFSGWTARTGRVRLKSISNMPTSRTNFSAGSKKPGSRMSGSTATACCAHRSRTSSAFIFRKEGLTMKDELVRAMTKDGFVNAVAVTTTGIVERARQIHKTLPTATAALGRLLTAASMMGNMQKVDDGSITLQLKGSGPLGRLLAVSDAEGNVRGWVENPQISMLEKTPGKLDVGAAVGADGTLTVIRDLRMKEPYVGTIDLVSGEIAEDITSYFAQSEQIPTACALGVLVGKDQSVTAAGGYIIQLLPGAPDDIIDKIEAGIQNAGAVSRLLAAGMDGQVVLETVLHGFDLEILETQPVEYRCYCSRDRVTRTLISLGRKELQSIVDDGKDIHIDCQFCDKIYDYTPEQVRQILKELDE